MGIIFYDKPNYTIHNESTNILELVVFVKNVRHGVVLISKYNIAFLLENN